MELLELPAGWTIFGDLSAFVIESRKDLQEDYQKTSSVFLSTSRWT
jgi:hypothetical protein